MIAARFADRMSFSVTLPSTRRRLPVTSDESRARTPASVPTV